MENKSISSPAIANRVSREFLLPDVENLLKLVRRAFAFIWLRGLEHVPEILSLHVRLLFVLHFAFLLPPFSFLLLFDAEFDVGRQLGRFHIDHETLSHVLHYLVVQRRCIHNALPLAVAHLLSFLDDLGLVADLLVLREDFSHVIHKLGRLELVVRLEHAFALRRCRVTLQLQASEDVA